MGIPEPIAKRHASKRGMTAEQKTAIQKVAVAYGWHEMTASDLGLLLWCLFRYYVMRL
jgi:hypothetical protein